MDHTHFSVIRKSLGTPNPNQLSSELSHPCPVLYHLVPTGVHSVSTGCPWYGSDFEKVGRPLSKISVWSLRTLA